MVTPAAVVAMVSRTQSLNVVVRSAPLRKSETLAGNATAVGDRFHVLLKA